MSSLRHENHQLKSQLEETRFRLDDQLRINSKLSYQLEEMAADTLERQENENDSKAPINHQVNFANFMQEASTEMDKRDATHEYDFGVDTISGTLQIYLLNVYVTEFRQRRSKNIAEEVGFMCF